MRLVSAKDAVATKAGVSRYLTQPRAPVPLPTWEYAVIHMDPMTSLDSLREWLDVMGSYGWELCERRDEGIGVMRGERSWALIFKRRTT